MAPLLLTAMLPLLIGCSIYSLPQLQSVWGRSRWLLGLAVAIVLADLLPEALHELGPIVLPVFVLAILLPRLIESLLSVQHRSGAHSADEGHLSLELGFLSLLLHQAGDGFGMALSEHRHGGHSYLFAVALHSLPLLLAAALSLRDRLGTGPALLRLALLSGATLSGGLLGTLTGAELPPTLMPWLQAVLGGLVLHMLAHAAPLSGWHLHSAGSLKAAVPEETA